MITNGIHSKTLLSIAFVLIIILIVRIVQESGSIIPIQISAAQAINQSQRSNSSAMTSGIQGTVYFMGTDCPPTLSKKVPPCTGPYPGYEVIIYANDGKTPIKSINTDANGTYFVQLTPGNYVIYTQAGPMPSQRQRNEIIVSENQISHKDLQIETGIR